jgi:hypothetical protein
MPTLAAEHSPVYAARGQVTARSLAPFDVALNREQPDAFNATIEGFVANLG